MWQNGIAFVSRKIHNDDSLQNLQMHIIAALYKNYYFNRTTPNIIPHHLRYIMGNLKDPTRSIHQFKNFPWILKYPIADKIYTQALSLPSIIIMPGPSVKSITNSIKKISKHNVTICISRSLKICLDAGVEPDFIVQYDTYAEQQHFYEDIPETKQHSARYSFFCKYFSLCIKVQGSCLPAQASTNSSLKINLF